VEPWGDEEPLADWQSWLGDGSRLIRSNGKSAGLRHCNGSVPPVNVKVRLLAGPHRAA
jgi:hypothetical protein